MNPQTKQELSQLASGRAVEGGAFLALLGDPESREDLRRLAAVRALLDGGPGAGEVPPMDVSWEELARHAEGTLDDEGRRQAVERFLNEHFPEGLQRLAGDRGRGTVDPHRAQDTTSEPPRPGGGGSEG